MSWLLDQALDLRSEEGGPAWRIVCPQPLSLHSASCDTAYLYPSDSVSLAYQRVQKVDCTSLRPVLILGPLLDVVKEMLVNEAPGKFCRCPLGKGSSPCLSLSVSVSSFSWVWIPQCQRPPNCVRSASGFQFFLRKRGQVDWVPNSLPAVFFPRTCRDASQCQSVLIPGSVLCRGDEGLPAGHRARCQRLPVCRL